MAGDWIKMRTNLDSDPRVLEIASALSLPDLQVVGCLWKLWSWADMHTVDGNDVRVTKVTLDKLVGVTGFADALRAVGWLVGRDTAITFPRFSEHNGQTAKNRVLTAKRVAKHKGKKGEDGNAEVTQQPLPREEKRREEDKKEKGGDAPISSFLDDSEFCERWEAYKQVSQSAFNWTIGGMQEQTALSELERDCKTVKVALEILDATIAAGSKHPHKVGSGRHRSSGGRKSNEGFKPEVKAWTP